MFSFKPDDSKPADVPYYEDATRSEGWQGYATTKSIKTLQDEITKAIQRLGGMVLSFQRGTYHVGNSTREGFQIHYSLQSASGALAPGRLDVAALPIHKSWRSNSESLKDKSLRMALYMVRTAFEGMWFMQQLSPGYAPLMPWMLNKDGKTISELWAESPAMQRLLPPGDADFVEGEVVDA